MTRLAITGHRGLSDRVMRLVDLALRAEITGSTGDRLVGVSSIADGADTLFAQAVLDAGGSLIAIIPASQYRDGLPVEHHATYDVLIARASEVVPLDFIESTSEAHMAASLRMLDEADRLLAVWDGQPARGYGGTADVVDAAHKIGLPVTVIWPPGATRD